jgi:D,D-heptose 1,7-bisphosphate phosphatase
MRQAVILAGGKGTRLASRLNGRPKPLIDILGKPLLEHQVEQLKAGGVTRIIVLVNHRADQIEAFCAARDNWGVELKLIDDGSPSGTAGAVFQAFDHLEDEFLVVYGDTLFAIDLPRFLAFHEEDPQAAASLFLHPNDHPQDSDLVEVDAEGVITGFHAYPHPAEVWLPNMVNAAFYAVRKKGLAPARAAFPGEGIVDFAKDVFPHLLKMGARMRGYVSPEYIKDIGTPDRLDRACDALAKGKVQRASLRERQTAVFLDRDGTLNRCNGYVVRPDQLELFDFTSQAVKLLNGSEHRVVMVTNQPVIARGDCTVEGLAQIHAKLETLLGRTGAFLDRIYYCPHHPDRGFPGEIVALKVECACRKPQPGMLLRARDELNIDLSASWLIGDSSADIRAASACGVTSVLVRTGEMNDTAELECLSDFTFDDALEAVKFITDGYDGVAEIARPIAQSIAPGSDIFIAGQSKSGKTTFARTLAQELRRNGRSAVAISLDRWMLPDAERTAGLLGRFDLNGATRTYYAARERAKGNRSLPDLPIFSARTRQRSYAAVSLDLKPETIVIWEGVVALDLARRADGLDRLVFVDCEEADRHHRVIAEYIRRGRSEPEAEQVYKSRLQDEIAPIEQGRAVAAQVVCLDAAPSMEVK